MKVWFSDYAKKAPNGKMMESWGGKEGKNLKELTVKITDTHKAIYETDPTDDEVIASFRVIVENTHKFYKGKRIPMLNMGYNDIIIELQPTDYKF